MLNTDPFRQPKLLQHTLAFIGGGASAPPPRNLTSELQQTLTGYQNTAPGFLALNQEFQPLYTQLGLGNLGTQLQGYTDASGNHVPGTTQLDQGVNTSNRIANTNDLATIGPAVTGTILQSNPYLYNSLNTLDRYSSNTPLLDQLNSQASAGLANNGALTPAQTRDVDQSTLGLFSNSGIANGNSAIAGQLFARNSALQANQDRARQFASGVQGLNVQQGGLAGNAASVESNALTNPLFQLLGLGNLTPGGNYSGSGSPTGSTVNTANDLFNPQSPYVQDLYNTNYNAQASTNIANANNSAATSSAVIGLIGSIFSDRRLKKDIKKTGQKTPMGLPLYLFKYRTDPTGKEFVGTMAQDVEKIAPEAVETDRLSGIKKVRYDLIDAPFSLMEQLAA